MLDLWGTPFAFETVSGLKRNMTKSSIFNINAYNMIDELGDSLGCKIEKFPTIYLVFHLRKRMSRECGRDLIYARTKKMSTWNKLYLSFVGRFILINSLSHDIPAY